MEENTYQKGHKITKVYFYIRQGLALANEFKYLIAGVIAFYYTLKLDNILWLFLMIIVSLPILFVAGWFAVHKMAKVLDWLGIEYGTYWSRYSFVLQERIIELLEKMKNDIAEIKEKLTKDSKNGKR